MQSISILIAALYALLTQAIGAQSDSISFFRIPEIMNEMPCLTLPSDSPVPADTAAGKQEKPAHCDSTRIKLLTYDTPVGNMAGNDCIDLSIAPSPCPYPDFSDQKKNLPDVKLWMEKDSVLFFINSSGTAPPGENSGNS